MAANFINIEEIIDSIELQKGIGDFTSRKTRYQIKEIAIRGVRHLDITQNYNLMSELIEINGDGTIDIPDDYLDYAAIYALNELNQLVPLTKNKTINVSLDPILDHNGEAILDHNGEKIYGTGARTNISNVSLINNVNSPYSYNNRMYASARYGAGGGYNQFGYFKVDVFNNTIQLDVNNTVTEVVLDYISDTVNSKYDILIPAVYREAMYAFINWKAVQFNRDFTTRDKEAAKRDYYRERRLARRKPLRLEEFLDTSNKQTKQSLKY